MPLDLSGFVTKEQDFGGLYKLADTIERRRYRDDQLKQQREGKRAGSLSFLNQYLDRRDFLTGTNYDPEIVRQLSDAMQEGAGLAQQGADTPTIMMALAPRINRLNEYSTKAKSINAQKKAALDIVKDNPGIDLQKFADEYDNIAFYEVDKEGNKRLKDISMIDPNVSYGDRLLKEFPERITTSGGFDEYFKQQSRNPVVRTEDVYRYTRTGGLSRDKVELQYENYLTPDIDQKGAITGFVPKYEVATEENMPIMGKFKDKSGKEVEAPVRLLDSGVFRSLNPDMLNYLKGQTKLVIQEHEKETGQKISLNSVQAENIARMIAYDELNKDTRKSGKIKTLEIANKPSPAEIRVNFGYPAYGKGSGGAEVQPTGNEFDKIVGNIKNLPVVDDKIRDKDGKTLYSGEWLIGKEQLPAGVLAILKTGGFDLAKEKNFTLDIQNGEIVGLTPHRSKTRISREDMERSQIKYLNPGKGEQSPGFGIKDESGGTISVNDIPAGTKLEQKGGKYYYKGKEVKL